MDQIARFESLRLRRGTFDRVKRTGCVMGGAALASAATVKLGGANGYSIGGKLPLSLAIAGAGFAGAMFLPSQRNLLDGIAEGALAAYAAGLGRKIGAHDFKDFLLGTGARDYGKLMEMNDPHHGRKAG